MIDECKGLSTGISIFACTEEGFVISEKDPMGGGPVMEASGRIKETDFAVPFIGCDLFLGWNLPTCLTSRKKNKLITNHLKAFVKRQKRKE